MKWGRIGSIILALLLLLIVAVGYNGFRIAEEEETVPLQISVVVNHSTGSRWTRFQGGLEDAAEDYGVTVNYAVTGSISSLYFQERIVRREAEDADGLILQLVDSAEAAELINSLSREKVLILVDTDAASEAGDACSSVTADNRLAGQLLAEAVREDFGEQTAQLRAGILSGNRKMDSMQERLQYFLNGFEEQGGTVAWTIANVSRLEQMNEEQPVNLLIALDNESLEAAVDAAENGTLDAAVYGVGCSDKTIYYLDKGMIRAMVVPDDFLMGYYAVSNAVERLRAPNSPMKNKTVTCRLIRPDTIYNEESEALLFPIIN
ncbi:MAG: substrate-binding domain-containing protein [Solobacterium sp.]|nr:substrate-binding domain-containing protein [Solobacterium sp.]